MLEKREMKTLTNLEKIFVVVDYEAFKNKCSFKHNGSYKEYCGTFGLTENDKPVECSVDKCPYVYAIVTEAKEDGAKKPTYIQ